MRDLGKPCPEIIFVAITTAERAYRKLSHCRLLPQRSISCSAIHSARVNFDDSSTQIQNNGFLRDFKLESFKNLTRSCCQPGARGGSPAGRRHRPRVKVEAGARGNRPKKRQTHNTGGGRQYTIIFGSSDRKCDNYSMRTRRSVPRGAKF